MNKYSFYLHGLAPSCAAASNYLTKMQHFLLHFSKFRGGLFEHCQDSNYGNYCCSRCCSRLSKSWAYSWGTRGPSRMQNVLQPPRESWCCWLGFKNNGRAIRNVDFKVVNWSDDWWVCVVKLLINVGGGGLVLFSGNGSIARNKNSHYNVSSLDTLWKGCDIEKDEVLKSLWSLTVKDSGVVSITVRGRLIEINGSVEGLTVE